MYHDTALVICPSGIYNEKYKRRCTKGMPVIDYNLHEEEEEK